MATSFNLPSLQSPLLNKSKFLGQNLNHKPSFPIPKQSSRNSHHVSPTSKFNLFEILGGRGLCNGEENLQKELQKKPLVPQTQDEKGIVVEELKDSTEGGVPEDGFGKELMGLTGGFPGGEKGVQKFIEKNPPPKKKSTQEFADNDRDLVMKKKPNPPELPMLLPGMIVIVKNTNNPFYMYCGIVQRITDGKAGVLFEGGNWDRLVSFRLDELERREKGPPMVNPKSAILETMVDNTTTT